MPGIYSEFASALVNDARLVKVSRFAEKKRASFGLPPLQPTGVEALRKILLATGFDKLQRKAESPASQEEKQGIERNLEVLGSSRT